MTLSHQTNATYRLDVRWQRLRVQQCIAVSSISRCELVCFKSSSKNDTFWGGGLLWLKGQTHVTCELQSAPSADPIWLYLQWCYKVWTSPQRPRGEGRWFIEEGHDEAVESWIAGDQSIIAPVALYWLCSPTGLWRSMRFQTFCVGQWGSVPGLTLTF